MTPREQSRIVNSIIGHTLIWVGFVVLAVMLIRGSIMGMTLMQFVARILVSTVICLTGFVVEEGA